MSENQDDLVRELREGDDRPGWRAADEIEYLIDEIERLTAENKNLRYCLGTVIVESGKELRITKHALQQLSPVDELVRTNDPKTGDIVFSVSTRQDRCPYCGDEKCTENHAGGGV